MEHTEEYALYTALSKLVALGELAGFSIEQMIQLLNAGLNAETLLYVIAWRLDEGAPLPYVNLTPCRWPA